MPNPTNSWSIVQLNPDGSQNGQPATLASLGIESATYDLNNMAADVLTFTVGGRAINAATLWPYGTLLALLKPNGQRAFVGRVEPWSRDGRPEAQNHMGRLVNPWWYLEKLMYQQVFNVTIFTQTPVVGQPNPPSELLTYTTPRVVLNILYNTNTGFYSATTGQQIADALQWAISQGAPIAIGEMDPATLPFSDFHQGVTCADVLKLQFRKEPDFVVDWDYTTLPFPTMHCRKQASFTPITIDLTNTDVREQVMIRERPDWQRSYVRIFYDQTDTTTAGSYLNIYGDWYSALGQGNSSNGVAVGAALPADTESKFRGVDLFCDLTGYKSQQTSQTGSIASVPFDITSLQTWQVWEPSLNDGTISQVTILTGTTIPAADPANYPAPFMLSLQEYGIYGTSSSAQPWESVVPPPNTFELIDGEWADWMNVTAIKVRAQAFAQIVTKKGERHIRSLHHDMTIVSLNTNGASQSFTSTNNNVTSYAEPVPVGLAKAMWTSWQNLAIEGNFTNVEAVIGTSQTISRSNCLNFLTANPGANGQPDWRNVKALVQRITGDILKGATKVDFGAPLHLTGHELIDAVRATRYRVTTIDLNYLFGGLLGGGASNVRIGHKTHARSAVHGIAHKQKDAVSQAISPAAGVDPIIAHDGATGITTWVPPAAPTQNLAGVVSSQPMVTIDPSQAKGSDGNWHALSIQEQKVCVNINGVLKQRTLLALTSAWYQAPTDPA